MKSQSIAILGGGILGLCAAYKAAQHGYRLTLYDPAGFPSQAAASYIAGGMLAPYSEIDLISAPMVAAGHESISFWRDFCHARDLMFLDGGSLFVAHPRDEHMLARFAAHLPADAQEDVWAHVPAQGVAQLEPTLANFRSGLYLKTEAGLQPKEIMRALCEALAAFDHVTLVSEASEPEILAQNHDYVFDCRGKWADLEGLRGVKGEIVVAHNPDFSLNRVVRLMHPRYPLYIVPRPDHHFMIGATSIEGSGDERVSVRSAMELLSALHVLHPSFADAHIVALESGIRPAYSDNIPRLSRSGNIVQINGSYRHGYLLGPILADEALSMIEGQAQNHLFLQEAV